MIHMIEEIPQTIDSSQAWLVEYWAKQLGISTTGLRLCVHRVGPEVRAIEKHLNEGIRIAIKEDDGKVRLVARITPQSDGFSLSVPYHTEKQGTVFELPLQYDKTEFFVPVSEMKCYSVSDTVKLSCHMDGFVQFSRGGQKPIVSGYNRELNVAKGAGLHAPDPVIVTSGPICGVIAQGLHGFRQRKNEKVELFESKDFWHHPKFSGPNDTAYNLEVFMFNRQVADRSRIVDGNQIATMPLPFNSPIHFEFDIRIIELPHRPYVLGAILSRMTADVSMDSGYSLAGPGCGDPASGVKKSIMAQYPPPSWTDSAECTSLDYNPDES